MGVRSWFCIPVLLRSRIPGILGMQARGNANFIQDCGNVECKRIGTLNSRSFKEMTGYKVSPHPHTRTLGDTGLPAISGQG